MCIPMWYGPYMNQEFTEQSAFTLQDLFLLIKAILRFTNILFAYYKALFVGLRKM